MKQLTFIILILTGIHTLLNYVYLKRRVKEEYRLGYIQGQTNAVDSIKHILDKHFGKNMDKSDIIGIDIDSLRYTIYKLR